MKLNQDKNYYMSEKIRINTCLILDQVWYTLVFYVWYGFVSLAMVKFNQVILLIVYSNYDEIIYKLRMICTYLSKTSDFN